MRVGAEEAMRAWGARGGGKDTGGEAEREGRAGRGGDGQAEAGWAGNREVAAPGVRVDAEPSSFEKAAPARGSGGGSCQQSSPCSGSNCHPLAPPGGAPLGPRTSRDALVGSLLPSLLQPLLRLSPSQMRALAPVPTACAWRQRERMLLLCTSPGEPAAVAATVQRLLDREGPCGGGGSNSNNPKRGGRDGGEGTNTAWGGREAKNTAGGGRNGREACSAPDVCTVSRVIRQPLRQGAVPLLDWEVLALGDALRPWLGAQSGSGRRGVSGFGSDGAGVGGSGGSGGSGGLFGGASGGGGGESVTARAHASEAREHMPARGLSPWHGACATCRAEEIARCRAARAELMTAIGAMPPLAACLAPHLPRAHALPVFAAAFRAAPLAVLRLGARGVLRRGL
jgi:hypothetical protein